MILIASYQGFFFLVQLPTAGVNTTVHVEDLSGYLTRLYQVEDRVHNVLMLA